MAAMVQWCDDRHCRDIIGQMALESPSCNSTSGRQVIHPMKSRPLYLAQSGASTLLPTTPYMYCNLEPTHRPRLHT